MRSFRLTLLLVPLALAACGGGETDTASATTSTGGDTTTTTEAEEATTTTDDASSNSGTPGDLPDPCTLLSSDDIEAALGSRIDGEPFESDPRFGDVACQSNTDAGTSFQLEFWESAEFAQNRVEFAADGDNGVVIAGLGDSNAFDADFNILHVVDGDNAFSIIFVLTGSDADDVLAAAEALGQAVIANL